MKSAKAVLVLSTMAVLASLAGCGGSEETITIYLKQRLGPDGPTGQIAPVLMPAERNLRDGMSPEYQAVLFVRQGPASSEWGRGFMDTMKPETRFQSVTVDGSTATVELTGREPDLYASAAIVYSLMSLSGVEAVRLQLDRKPCCVYTHENEPVPVLTSLSFKHWQGEPCGMRTESDAVQCRPEA